MMNCKLQSTTTVCGSREIFVEGLRILNAAALLPMAHGNPADHPPAPLAADQPPLAPGQDNVVRDAYNWSQHAATGVQPKSAAHQYQQAPRDERAEHEHTLNVIRLIGERPMISYQAGEWIQRTHDGATTVIPSGYLERHVKWMFSQGRREMTIRIENSVNDLEPHRVVRPKRARSLSRD